MDGGYSSTQIEDYSHSIGVVPVIDFKADRNGNKREMDKAKKDIKLELKIEQYYQVRNL